MKNKTISLKDLGITDEDLIHCEVKELEDGGAEFFYEFTDEAQAILDAFCHRENIDIEKFLKATLLSDPVSMLDLKPDKKQN